MTQQAFELFGEFLEKFKLVNTRETIAAEASWTSRDDVRRPLEDTFAPKKDECLAQALLEKFRAGEAAGVKSQMRDLREKSEQLDRLLERRAREPEKVKVEEKKAAKPAAEEPHSGRLRLADPPSPRKAGR